jgi:hypothetical protein
VFDDDRKLIAWILIWLDHGRLSGVEFARVPPSELLTAVPSVECVRPRLNGP